MEGHRFGTHAPDRERKRKRKALVRPKNPNNSAIIKGIEWKNLLFGLIPVFFSYFSILIAWGIIIGLIENRRKAELVVVRQ